MLLSISITLLKMRLKAYMYQVHLKILLMLPYLRGSGIFLDLYDSPQEIHELMELSTQLVIELKKG